MEYGQKVLIYVDDIEKWQVGELIERYAIVQEGILESWRIQVVASGTAIVRYIKDSKELKQDGCGYLLKEGKEIKAKVNFNNWDLEEWSESCDENEVEYYQNLFANKDEVYTFKWSGIFWEVMEVTDERNEMLFEPKEVIMEVVIC